jgi:hypothetical protein
MPTSAQLTVGTTAQKVASSNGSPIELHLHCASGNVYLDGSNVTSSSGYRMDSGQTMVITLADHEELWAIASTGTSTLYMLYTVL